MRIIQIPISLVRLLQDGVFSDSKLWLVSPVFRLCLSMEGRTVWTNTDAAEL